MNTTPASGLAENDDTFPQPGSPAIDRGFNFSGVVTDQRGGARTVDFLDVPNVPGGDGTDI